ncbi:MAG: UDPGP type 1 family protein [Verrucomicrobia bacterium]|nr:UDPGP type 1 family protein [Verrucomicrobiota bacterium]
MKHSLISQFENAGQGQVFRFWDELSPGQQTSLLEEAEEIDMEEIAQLHRSLVLNSQDEHHDFPDLEPAPFIAHPAQGGDSSAWAEARNVGDSALRSGSVAAFVVAGGQGTRLGYDKPKGIYPVTPLKEKSLFQVFAEKIRAAENTYETTIPWFIMASHGNFQDTVDFFESNNHFGLQSGQVHFFRQGRMPAIDLEGKILLSCKSSIAMSPDGHGGSLRALVRSGATKIMEENGIDVLSYFQVDNPLIKVIDPAFIGFHLQSQSGMSSKMIPKAYAEEKVGVFCTQQDKTVVIEYSDLPEDLMHARDESGQLKFLSGSIAIHMLSREFVNQMGGAGSTNTSLPFHRADKKIPTLDDEGNPIEPESPNGVKFEMFVFDALPFSEKTVVIETQRSSDFSPVKNAEGLDSPHTSKEDQMKEFVSWLNTAGEAVATDANGVPLQLIEVSPLFGYDGPSFVKSWNALTEKPDLSQPSYLE